MVKARLLAEQVDKFANARVGQNIIFANQSCATKKQNKNITCYFTICNIKSDYVLSPTSKVYIFGAVNFQYIAQQIFILKGD